MKGVSRALYKIMIVDDSSAIRRGLNSFFEKENLGFIVCASFSDGKEAIDYLKDSISEVDVVLTDIKMHNLTGLDVAEFVKKQNLNIPVVLFSAYQEFDFAHKAISANVYSYLLKPVNFDKLRELFLEIRAKLDSENKDKLFEYLKGYNFEQFIHKSGAGAYETSDTVLKDFECMHLPVALLDFPCSFITVEVNNKDFYIKERIVKAINNIMYFNNMSGYRILENGDYCYILVVAASEELTSHFSLFEKRLEEVISNNLTESFELSGIAFDIIRKISFSNLLDMTTHFYESKEKVILEQLKQLTLTEAISHNVDDAQNCLGILFKKLSRMDEHYVVNFLKDFNETMVEHFGEADKIEFTEGGFYSQYKQLEKELTDAAQNATDYQASAMQKALNYLEENYTKDICIADVANHIYLNQVYFGRIFKIKTGKTFTEYLINKRLALAKKLLKSGQSVSKTAVSVGYTNVQYFIRIFRKNTGFTPGEYKRLGEEKDEA